MEIEGVSHEAHQLELLEIYGDLHSRFKSLNDEYEVLWHNMCEVAIKRAEVIKELILLTEELADRRNFHNNVHPDDCQSCGLYNVEN